jgi:hypothetical protein
MVVIGGHPAQVMVPSGQALPWDEIFLPPTVSTPITFDNNGGVAPGTVTGGEIIISDTGYFLVTVGIMPDLGPPGQDASPFIFDVTVNGVATQDRAITFKSHNAGNVATYMSGLTFILYAPTNPTYVQVVNFSGFLVMLNNALLHTGSGPAAYVTLAKIHD